MVTTLDLDRRSESNTLVCEAFSKIPRTVGTRCDSLEFADALEATSQASKSFGFDEMVCAPLDDPRRVFTQKNLFWKCWSRKSWLQVWLNIHASSSSRDSVGQSETSWIKLSTSWE